MPQPNDEPATDLLLAAWQAGFTNGAPQEKDSDFGVRTHAVSAAPSERDAKSGVRPHAVSSAPAKEDSDFGVRTPAVSSGAPFPLRPRFGQRTGPKPSPRKPGGQPGNRNRLVHGYRSAAIEGPRRAFMEELREVKRLCAITTQLCEWRKTGEMPAGLADLLAQAAP